jgi:cyclopropane-fatty-acyl-phospholipid synthase
MSLVESSGASEGAIAHHYDVSTDFYRLWLDPTLTYSCAWFDGEDGNLAEAQRRKFDRLIGWLQLPESSAAIDIGCGWGAGLQALTSEANVCRATGLTLSKDQFEFAREALRGTAAEVEFGHWRDFLPSVPYQGMICVGALEHFARPGLGRERRVAAYGEFFQWAAKVLAPGARLSLQTIAVGSAPLARGDVDDIRFLMREIFPESTLPRLADVAAAAERHFEVERLRNDRGDYSTTCRKWAHALRDHEEIVTATWGRPLFDRYARYLDVAAQMFDRGLLVLYRLCLRNVARG